MNRLSFCFKSSQVNGWPKIKILIDDIVIKDHSFSQPNEIVDIELLPTPGPHVLKIERYGKTNDNVIFDSTSFQIIEDQVLELLDILIDGVSLPKMFLYQGIWCWGDKKEPSSLFWGPNGVWIWEFETPIVLWAIKQNRQRSQSHTDLLSPFRDDCTQIYKYLDQFEKAIHDYDKKNSTGQ